MGLLWGAVALVVGQAGAALLGPLVVSPVNEAHVLRELRGQSRINIGTILSSVRRKGTDSETVGRCVIETIRLSGIRVRLLDGSDRTMTWPLTDWKHKLDPLVEPGGPVGRGIKRRKRGAAYETARAAGHERLRADA